MQSIDATTKSNQWQNKTELASNPADADAAGDLAKLLEAGQLRPELQAEAAAALDRYQ